MKKYFTFLVFLIFAINFLPICTFATPKDSLAVRKEIMGFPEAWNHHDMNAFGKLFTKDAEFVSVGGLPPFKGRSEIQVHHAWLHGTIPADSKIDGKTPPPAMYGLFKNSTIHFNTIEISFLRKDVAVAHVAWELWGDSRVPNDPREGELLFVLTPQNGHWLITIAQNTEKITKALKYIITNDLRKYSK